jgi:anti-sigma B factor antagonist
MSSLLCVIMSTFKIFQPTRILSAANSGAIIDWIEHNLDSGTLHLLIDLVNVSFMDSSGVGGLVVALKRVQAAGGTLALCSLNGQARMLFELAAMDQMFKIYANPQEYKTALSANATAVLQ